MTRRISLARFGTVDPRYTRGQAEMLDRWWVDELDADGKRWHATRAGRGPLPSSLQDLPVREWVPGKGWLTPPP